jgi:L-alanine-DL-glutamate epimerase-like enolase superfamily enzyme
MTIKDSSVPIESMSVASYTVPTGTPESDGTLEWDATTLVLARVKGGGREGLGYGYADTATARLIQDMFAPLLHGRDAFAINARWHDMARAIRNLGRPGICSMALSIVDVALWDLKARCLEQPLGVLLGPAHADIPIYGSGGFTSYTIPMLQAQLGVWAEQGMTRVKMKVGRSPADDLARVGAVAQCIGAQTELFVDANGAYTRKQALWFAQRFSELQVTWFEEPVSSDDLAGLRLLCDRAPAGMAISAGEYGYDLPYFRRMLETGAVDILQADATRCGGITGFLGVATLCEAFGVPLSSHCAPSLHAPLCCAARPAVHLEYFHDHVRIEQRLFDGAPEPRDGRLAPPRDRPGLGLEFKEEDARCFRNP